ncbi:MAG TPA: hypothetical protein VFU89_00795, partial [Rhabdochlamydiaceae bacterium]|nr:hypothetical protein [Rhabdochlamydiaceae bacterium]
ERSVRRNPAPSGAGQDELSIQEAEGDVRSPASLNRRRISPVNGGVLQSTDQFFVSDDPEKFQDLGKAFLGHPLPKVSLRLEKNSPLLKKKSEFFLYT